MSSVHTALLKAYKDNLAGSSPHVMNQLLRIISGFLSYAGDQEIDKAVVFRYLEKMRRGKYADGTINMHYRTISTFLTVNGIKILARKDAPRIRESEVIAPALDPELVAEMIGQKENLSSQQCALLALSTTYGLRRIEMISLTPASFNFSNNLVFIESAKGSRQRYHYIPQEIRVYLKDYDFSESISSFTANKIFWSIGKVIGLRLRGTEVNWHSVRRTLDTLLQDRLSWSQVRDFLRWKSAPGDMPGRYYSARRFFTRDGMSQEMGKADKVQDDKVFEVHPFLPLWR